MGEQAFIQGQLQQGLTITRGETPIVLERLSLNGQHPMMQQHWGLQRAVVLGSLFATPATQADYDLLIRSGKKFRSYIKRGCIDMPLPGYAGTNHAPVFAACLAVDSAANSASRTL